ncbi:uncharacterized protein LOC117167877 isoform X2 [Belonocnema kinseyi]|uniref:uncharacterized protein LOC117167877 isoform X2 n=1 Tax=Belonocnema kinseyi TaxID=2817044 RepID=UPI00143D6BE0|nr:uncharacterized protein LOC117167877 isoform X2 [Belonocnema kinseyi]
MKISASSLLIAIAGFLQESKCMLPPTTSTSSGTQYGRIVVSFYGNKDYKPSLYQPQGEPDWLKNKPTKNFPLYEVFVNTHRYGDYMAAFWDQKKSGYTPLTFEIMLPIKIEGVIREKVLKRGMQPFKDYTPGSFQRSSENVYVAIQGKTIIKYAPIKQEEKEEPAEAKKRNLKTRDGFDTDPSATKKRWTQTSQ